MATARRQKGGALRQPPRGPRSSSSAWPPDQGGGKPWYVEDWRFGQAPSPQEVAAAEEARRRQAFRIGVAVAAVIVVVAVISLILLL